MGKRNYEVYSAEFKMSAINQYQQSGMTIKAFAESIGVKPQTFYVWFQRIIAVNSLCISAMIIFAIFGASFF